MSVALLVSYLPDRGTREPSYLPLATESEFHRFWLPLAEANELHWVPQFAAGVSVDGPAVAELVAELEILAQAAPSSQLPATASAKIADRARRARELLAGLDMRTVEEVFIG
jgi:hypothetical protein